MSTYLEKHEAIVADEKSVCEEIKQTEMASVNGFVAFTPTKAELTIDRKMRHYMDEILEYEEIAVTEGDHIHLGNVWKAYSELYALQSPRMAEWRQLNPI